MTGSNLEIKREVLRTARGQLILALRSLATSDGGLRERVERALLIIVPVVPQRTLLPDLARIALADIVPVLGPDMRSKLNHLGPGHVAELADGIVDLYEAVTNELLFGDA